MPSPTPAPDPLIGNSAALTRLVELAEAQLTAMKAIRAQLAAVQAELTVLTTGKRHPGQPPRPSSGPLTPLRRR